MRHDIDPYISSGNYFLKSKTLKEDEFHIQSYTLKDLAKRYHTSPKIFRAWLKKFQAEIGPRVGYFYNPRQVKIIVDHIGAPFVALFGFLMNFSDALGRSLDVQHHNNDHHGATDDPAPASTDTHHTDTTVAQAEAGFDSSAGLILSTLMLMLSHLSVVTNVNQRWSSRLRVARFIFQVSVLSGSFFYAGYRIGKVIF